MGMSADEVVDLYAGGGRGGGVGGEREGRGWVWEYGITYGGFDGMGLSQNRWEVASKIHL